MYIKIYFNEKPLFLCDEMNQEIKNYAKHDDAVFIDEFSNASVNSMIHEMKLEKVHAGIFLHKDLEQLKKSFWKKFLVIKAGGGLVQNENDELLFIFRRNKWDLPKGKLDKGETIEQCAVREVEEETGIKNIVLKKRILVTNHTYDENGKHILKETYWYKMKATADQELVPQLEEQITELRWLTAEEAHGIFKKTYPSIGEVLHAAGYD
jgi:8-oxo-dGTP pyrophosphatase MutT (NUDIX family)